MTITPNPGFRELHRLLDRLRHSARSTPATRTLTLQLSWADVALDGGSVTVKPNNGSADASARGYIRPDGSFEKARCCNGQTMIALRNLAADPARRFRRFGQEASRSPFRRTHLGFGELASAIGYCAECASHVRWPHDERAAERAEEALRRHFMREMEDEGRDGEPSAR